MRLGVWETRWDLVVAASADDAAEIGLDELEEPPGRGGAAEDWKRVPDGDEISMVTNPGSGILTPTTKLAREWAADNGRGHLGARWE